MTTITIRGHHIVYDESDGIFENTSISEISAKILTNGGASAFSYSVIGNDMEVEGLEFIRIDSNIVQFQTGGTTLHTLPGYEYFATELTTPQGTSTVFGWFSDSGNISTDSYFVLDGPEVAPDAWLEAWEDVFSGSASSYSFAVPQGAMGPGMQIPWSSFNDHSITQRDVYSGTSEADSFNGGAGKDKIAGNGGGDTLAGGGGKDRLDGGQGNDDLSGGAKGDKLNGGRGDDMLTGGSGADRFIFKGSFGDDTVADFQTSGRREKIDLRQIEQITSFRDLKNNHLSENGDGDAVISGAGRNTITLDGVGIADLSANDFLF